MTRPTHGAWDRMCEDVRRHISSFLDTSSYGTLLRLRRFDDAESRCYERCIHRYRIRSLECFRRLLRQPRIVPYIQHLRIDCCSDTSFMFKSSHHTVFSNVQSLMFTSTYTHFPLQSLNWSAFFEGTSFPMLTDVEWRHVSVSRDAWRGVREVWETRGICANVRRLRVMAFRGLCMRTDLDDGPEELIQLYKACTNIEQLFLDRDDVYNDAPYVSLFATPFPRVKSLHLVNRTMIVVESVCKNVHILPALEHLRIAWIHPIDEEDLVQRGVALYIQKPSLKTLDLEFQSMYLPECTNRTTRLPIALHLFASNPVVMTHTPNVHIDVMASSCSVEMCPRY